MRIKSLRIQNFRGIKHAQASDLGNTIIIAGQNGSGKSCIYDAIRLFKSVYGGYQYNEWQQWFGEFQIDPSASGEELLKIFNDPTMPIEIEVEVELHDAEKQLISSNAATLFEDHVWKTMIPEAYGHGGYRLGRFAGQFREREPEVKDHVKASLPEFSKELSQKSMFGRVTVNPGERMHISPSFVLPTIFDTYRPHELGVIDYHGAQRHYNREKVQNLNISLEETNRQGGANSLYNYANKYNNVKSEMAAAYVKEMLAEKAGIPIASQSTLTETLKELFKTFFPHKEFLGPVPTGAGGLSFPVRTPTGSEHDLDDLSAGEKEILYGYLRIRNSAPRFSIILLDEPELHLNPKLIRDLPDFYREHLGHALDNQIWLVSHSDALLREAVGKPGFDIFHMQGATSIAANGDVGSQANQLKKLSVDRDLDLLMTDLVGDLAAYQPGRKAVIFEGGGDTDFDQWMTSKLFPELGEHANLISGTNKRKVEALHEVLERAHEKGQLQTKFFAIVDHDFDGLVSGSLARHSWDRYHIENYLLDDKLISDVISSFRANENFTPEEALEAQKRAARAIVPRIVRQKLSDFANDKLMSAIKVGADPAADNIGGAIDQTVQNSVERILKTRQEVLTSEIISQKREAIQDGIEESFANGSWKKSMPGRPILSQICSDEKLGIRLTQFRTMLVNRMAEGDFEKPEGMQAVVDAIISA